MTTEHAVGIVLAAGAGSRMGRPKVLVDDWLQRAIRALCDGGCEHVLVTLGAAQVAVPPPSVAVPVPDWAEGLSASVRAGFVAANRLPHANCAVILTVDTPDVPAVAVARVIAAGRSTGLARAVYGGRPGHPVALARSHWAQAATSARGDAGLRDYLTSHTPVLVECGDLATGEDVDVPVPGSTPSPVDKNNR